MHTTDTRLRILLTFALLAATTAVCLSLWRFQNDDAYIFYAYVKNLLNGQGYVFNPGERVNGTTSALYPLLLSALAWIVGASTQIIPVLAHVILALALAVALLGVRALINKSNKDWLACILPALFFLASPHLVDASGMETFLTLSLLVAGYLAYQQEKLAWSALSLGLAVLSRPDSLLFSMLVAGDYILRKRSLPPLSIVAIFLLPILPWIFWSTWYFGSPLPLSLGAKLALTEAGRTGLTYPFLQRLPAATWLISENIAAFETVALVGLSIFVFIKSPGHPIRFFILWAILYTLAYGLLLNTPGFRWYYIPLILVQALVFGRAAELICLKNTRATKLFRLLVFALLISVIGVRCFQRLSGTVNSKFTHYKSIAETLNNEANPGDSLASAEIGILRYYYTQGPIIDALGLITPGVAEQVRNKDFGRYILELKPTYVLCAQPPRRKIEAFCSSEWFRALYGAPRIFKIAKKSSALFRRQGQ